MQNIRISGLKFRQFIRHARDSILYNCIECKLLSLLLYLKNPKIQQKNNKNTTSRVGITGTPPVAMIIVRFIVRRSNKTTDNYKDDARKLDDC